MMKNKKIIYWVLLVCVLAILGFGLFNHFLKQEETNPVVVVAKEHLKQYGHYPVSVKKIEVVEEECEANRYWERFDQPPIESPLKYPCWVVRFYYLGYAEGSHLMVFVDKNTNEVIGGTQTR